MKFSCKLVLLVQTVGVGVAGANGLAAGIRCDTSFGRDDHTAIIASGYG